MHGPPPKIAQWENSKLSFPGAQDSQEPSRGIFFLMR
jgi:hypothetical protein